MAQVKIEEKDEDSMDVDITDADATVKGTTKLENISTRRRTTRTGARSAIKRTKDESSDDELIISPSKIKSAVRKVFNGVELPTMSPRSSPIKAEVG